LKHDVDEEGADMRISLTIFSCLFIISCKDGKPPQVEDRLDLEGADTLELRLDFERREGQWEVVSGKWARNDKGVFVQSATVGPYHVALFDGPKYSDVDVTVRIRPVSGSEDASGGIVFRAGDGRNYYVVRANALEDNLRLYTVIDGTRRQIAGTQIPAPALGNWHTLRIVAIGDRIQASLNGELLIDHRDGAFRNGRVGLWTKADSVTEFDDLLIRGVRHD
jgi:hypothetical protein